MDVARKRATDFDGVEEWMSLVAAARALGESRQTVLNRAVKGELTAQHIAGRTVVRKADVDRLIESRS